jgi:cobalt/nickel transport system permease protein
MHIAEGILPLSLLATGAALSLAGTALGLKRTEQEEIPVAAVMAAAFFVASLIHVPLGPSSVHLLLLGLVGLLTGWACFPAILVALLLQALFFQYGGLSVLGINTFNMALPALLAHIACGPMVRSPGRKLAVAGAFLAGAGAILAAGLFTAATLALAGEAFLPAAQTILLAHIPVAAIEGLITVAVIGFIQRVKPEMLATRSEQETP